VSKRQRTPEEVLRPLDYKKKVEKSLGAFGIQVIRLRYVLLFLIVLAAGFLSIYIPQINIATSLESSFKGHNQAIQEYQEFRDLFGRDDKIVLLIKSEDIFSIHFLDRLKKFHEDLESTLPLLSEVNSLINARYIEGKDGTLQVNDFFENLPQTAEQAEILKEKALAYPLYKNFYITQNGDSMIMVIKTQAVSALTDDGRPGWKVYFTG
jgi:predicted RND superfamily exporter protein